MNPSPLGRIVEIAEEGRHLAKSRGFLTIASNGIEIGRVPLADIAAVLATALSTTVYCGPVMRHPAAPLQAANFSSAI